MDGGTTETRNAAEEAAKAPSDPLRRYELATLAGLFLIALLFARPELEGWATLSRFPTRGVAATFDVLFGRFYVRYVESVPLTLAWWTGGAQGVGVIYGIFVVLKYLCARWAIAPLVSPNTRWVLASLAAVMFPWAQQWHGHNLAQLLATLFVVAAAGAAIRLRDAWSWRYAGLLALTAHLALATYEGVVLCVLAIAPLAVVLSERRSRVATLFRVLIPIAVGCAAYAAVWLLGRSAYQSSLTAGSAYRRPLAALSALFDTLYFRSPYTVPFLAGIAAAVTTPLFSSPRWRWGVATFIVGVYLIPLFALPYFFNYYFLADIERVGMPTGVGFFLLCVLLAVMAGGETPRRVGIVAVASLGCASAVNAFGDYRAYLTTVSIVSQLKEIIEPGTKQTYLLRDWTGTLGDRYTFSHPATLGGALVLAGVRNRVDVCTPRKVNRVHPVLSGMGIFSSMPWCDDLPAKVPKDSILIDARGGGRGLLAAPPTLKLVR